MVGEESILKFFKRHHLPPPIRFDLIGKLYKISIFVFFFQFISFCEMLGKVGEEPILEIIQAFTPAWRI